MQLEALGAALVGEAAQRGLSDLLFAFQMLYPLRVDAIRVRCFEDAEMSVMK